jgi:SagB-type dehydrogenase family enzyme
MTLASEYLNAIVRRNRTPMEEFAFEPNWADQPRRHNVYPGIRPIPLPSGEIALSSVDEALVAPPGDGLMSLAALSEMLRESYGYGGRRLGVTANGDTAVLPQYSHATWSRGTASGGGLYPLEIYWVCGPSGPMLPGVYNYSAPHHAMQRLLVGDVSAQVRRALPPGEADRAGDQFLLVTNKFWKNAFKYRTFCYHAVSMDVGTALGSWQLWSKAAGIALRPLLNFDEPALNQLLGLETIEESVFAVVPLPWQEGSASASARADAETGVRVEVAPVERSRTVVRYPIVEEVHLSTVGLPTGDDLPARLDEALADGLAPGTEGILALADPLPLDLDLREALRVRRSSFGRFSAHLDVAQAELGAVLRAGTIGARLVSDVKHADGGPALTRLATFVNHVDGIPAGLYDYDLAGHSLAPIHSGEVGSFLQRNYFLKNYNLEQAAAVVVVLARPQVVMNAVGQRGYRYVNAEVGATAQALYTAAAAAGLGCGAALGFDNVSYFEQLWSEQPGADEWPLLIVMLGHERRRAPNFQFRLS